ncbi:MAG TPA: flagellar hook protein FlgE [Verrucomicrobiae bacterium]|nr:flagellar hook protein FlgE [Verrucomicrobiae bacterium]
MFPAFSTALSALNAESSAIDVTGNNLANLNTTGFKSSQVEFSDLMSQSLGVGQSSDQIGLGVGPIQSEAIYSQGSITNTNAPLNAAIQGNGFFVVNDPSTNQQLYTRDGNFQLSETGQLETSNGQLVQGWTAVNGTVNTNGAVSSIILPMGATIPAKPTSTMSVDVNLNAQATTGSTSGTFSAPIQVYDSLGASHTLTVTFTQTASNAWSYSVTIPAADVKGSGTPSPLATGTLTFNSSGILTSPAAGAPVSVKMTGLADGAADQTISWNLFDTNGNSLLTQFAQASSLASTQQDGNAPGQITSVALQNGGAIVATYSNGQQSTIGQVAVASIANPQTLINVGNNNLQASALTAPAAIGTANTGGRGQIMGGALEASTSDMATEFTNLLSYERSYQAAARVITTSDQLLQETVNLIHG